MRFPKQYWMRPDWRKGGLATSYNVPPRANAIHNRMLADEEPVDLTLNALLRSGARSLLGQATEPESRFRRSPKEELQRLQAEVDRLATEIEEALANLEEERSRLMKYREDGSVVQYYKDVMQIIVEDLKSAIVRRGKESDER